MRYYENVEITQSTKIQFIDKGVGGKATSPIGRKAATVDFPFETSIPTEFIINPPEIMIWHTAVYSTPVQSPE